jgi:hypothetical protein
MYTSDEIPVLAEVRQNGIPSRSTVHPLTSLSERDVRPCATLQVALLTPVDVNGPYQDEDGQRMMHDEDEQDEQDDDATRQSGSDG